MNRLILGACAAALLAASGCTNSLGGLAGAAGALAGTTPNGGGTAVGTTPGTGTGTGTTTTGASCSAPNYKDSSSAWTVPASGFGSYGGQHLPPNWSGYGSSDEIQSAIEGVSSSDRACFKTRWPGGYEIFKRNGGSW